jgi:chemotaxis response regulator CheB
MTRVYLIFHTQMFREAVGAILAGQPEITLAGVMQDPTTVVQDVAELKPDVILMEENATGSPPEELHALLSSHIPCRLILLRLDADGMHVWSQAWHRTVQSQDLVDAIITTKQADGGGRCA